MQGYINLWNIGWVAFISGTNLNILHILGSLIWFFFSKIKYYAVIKFSTKNIKYFLNEHI